MNRHEPSPPPPTQPLLRPWRTTARRELLAAPPHRIAVWVETVELPDGRVIDDYYQAALADHVVIHACTADGLLVCLRQYRHGARRVGLTLPAGQIEPGEDPLAAAQRELLEETGYRSAAWTALGAYPISGTQGVATAHLFQAELAERVAAPRSGDLEDSDVETLSPAVVDRAVADGEFLILTDVAAVGLARLPRR
jgi:ADP-ribose pyrophosphatase